MHVGSEGDVAGSTANKKSCVESPTVISTEPSPGVPGIVKGIAMITGAPEELNPTLNPSAPGRASAPLAVAVNCH
jgi:hypothetical protein